MAKMLIGGELVDSVSRETYEVRNPATGAAVDKVPRGTVEDVKQAIQAAETAFKEWSDTTAEDRGSALMSACELIKKNSGEIAQLLTQEQGKTLFESGLEIHHLLHGLEFYAGLASKVRGSHVPLPQKGAYGMVVRQPIGICGGIVPWNFPLTLMGTKLGPALAAGNTIIIKPASTTPLATVRTIELIQQATYGEGKAQKSLPKGAVNVMSKETRMGPIHLESQRQEVEEQVEDAKSRGAKTLVGGERPKGGDLDRGHFYMPTLLSNVPDDARVTKEEVFGPALPVYTFKTIDEAIEKANASEYGLGSSIWTRNPIYAY